MKSGLEGRNNVQPALLDAESQIVSMKSGLEGRNNGQIGLVEHRHVPGLNEVRPRRPEQSMFYTLDTWGMITSQ